MSKIVSSYKYVSNLKINPPNVALERKTAQVPLNSNIPYSNCIHYKTSSNCLGIKSRFFLSFSFYFTKIYRLIEYQTLHSSIVFIARKR